MVKIVVEFQMMMGWPGWMVHLDVAIIEMQFTMSYFNIANKDDFGADIIVNINILDPPHVLPVSNAEPTLKTTNLNHSNDPKPTIETTTPKKEGQRVIVWFLPCNDTRIIYQHLPVEQSTTKQHTT
jgi:hypothetical protein